MPFFFAYFSMLLLMRLRHYFAAEGCAIIYIRLLRCCCRSIVDADADAAIRFMPRHLLETYAIRYFVYVDFTPFAIMPITLCLFYR